MTRRRTSSSVSVVMATCNGARFIEAQLRSVLDQTRPPTEIVICDDHSTDDTVERVEALAGASRVPIAVHLNEERLGFISNFFQAVSLASGDVLAWCDQDDVWLPRKLEIAVAALSRPGTLLVVHGATRVAEDGRHLGVLASPMLPRYRARSGHPFLVPHGFRQVFSRRLLDHHSPSELPTSFGGLPTAHDEWTYMAAHASGGVRWLRTRLVDYRVHGGNASGALPSPTFAEDLLVRRPGLYSEMIEVALRRAAYFEVLYERHPQQHHLADTGRWYRRYASNIERRRHMSRGNSTRSKLERIARMTLDHVYAPRRGGGLGTQALAKDLLLSWRASEDG